jgi:F-type H+-transporting ATPase subunit epsilon
MAATLRLEIVTPDAKAYSEDVEMVTLPAAEGEMGIFPQHVPLMAQIVAGEIVARKDGRDYFLAVGEGFVEITGERVAIMTDMAIRAENIDEAKAEEARQRAEARMAERLGDAEAAMIAATLANSLAQLKVKRRQHR